MHMLAAAANAEAVSKADLADQSEGVDDGPWRLTGEHEEPTSAATTLSVLTD